MQSQSAPAVALYERTLPSVLPIGPNLEAAKQTKRNSRACFVCKISETEAGRKFNYCGHCGGIRYCSKACQTGHWPAHKALCRLSVSNRMAARELLDESEEYEELASNMRKWKTEFSVILAQCANAASDAFPLQPGCNIAKNILFIRIDKSPSYFEPDCKVKDLFVLDQYQILQIADLGPDMETSTAAMIAGQENVAMIAFYILSSGKVNTLSASFCRESETARSAYRMRGSVQSSMETLQEAMKDGLGSVLGKVIVPVCRG